MLRKKTKKAQLKLISSDVKEKDSQALDELALLIQSINQSAKKAKAKNIEQADPEPPLAA